MNPDDLISKLVAEDGVPFSVVATSASIRYMYEASTKQKIPSSPNTIREVMRRCFAEKKEVVTNQIAKLKSNGKKFSVTLDEWTSAANRRYMNINVHAAGEFFNLGLARIRGTFTAEACLEIVTSKLSDFNINLKDDIFGLATDGAAVMKKFGRLTGRKQLLCMAHGIHLAVIGVLYTQQDEVRSSNDVSAFHTSEEEEEDVETSESPIAEAEHEEPELMPTLKEVITKIRRTVKFFRKSPSKTEVLVKYSGSGLSLILDTKTRWNSLLTMLERVHKLSDAMQKAMIDLREQIILTETDFGLIEELIKSRF
ncbi:unnamed protein product [Orchesella dallaii]|uniref:Transposase n=1 Tax=Orchesella dallaii TaxID=48710 RepID=A0ABP1RK71_9HEXA